MRTITNPILPEPTLLVDMINSGTAVHVNPETKQFYLVYEAHNTLLYTKLTLEQVVEFYGNGDVYQTVKQNRSYNLNTGELEVPVFNQTLPTLIEGTHSQETLFWEWVTQTPNPTIRDAYYLGVNSNLSSSVELEYVEGEIVEESTELEEPSTTTDFTEPPHRMVGLSGLNKVSAELGNILSKFGGVKPTNTTEPATFNRENSYIKWEAEGGSFSSDRTEGLFVMRPSGKSYPDFQYDDNGVLLPVMEDLLAIVDQYGVSYEELFFWLVTPSLKFRASIKNFLTTDPDKVLQAASNNWGRRDGYNW